MDIPFDIPLGLALLAPAPMLLLAVLVLSDRVKLTHAAWGSAVIAGVLAVTAFELPVAGLASGAGKGAWTGLWILGVVVPGLLLFQVAETSGALERLSEQLTKLAPTRGRATILFACVFPSFLQGAAGYGVPLAVTAPMAAKIFGPVVGIATILVGYQWSVSFGSTGSPYFTTVAVAHLSQASAAEFAAYGAILVVINLCVAMALALWRSGSGIREVAVPAVVIALAMSVTLIATALIQPAIASLAAALVGLLVSAKLLPKGQTDVDWRLITRSATPYIGLTVIIAVAFAIAPVADLLDQVPAIAPAFDGSQAALGHVNEPVAAHQPFRPLQHPAVYLVVAALGGIVAYRRFGWWPAGTTRQMTAAFWKRTKKTSPSVVGLTVLAGIMVEAGMVGAFATTLTALLGVGYLVVAPVLGTLGATFTGSTTASNALFAPLQVAAAQNLSMSETVMLAAQSTGANVGNALTPVNALIACVAVGAEGSEGKVLRKVLPAAGILMVVAVLSSAVLMWAVGM